MVQTILVQESSTAIYAFMENLFAKNVPGIFTIATIGDCMPVKIMLAEIVGTSFTACG